MIASSMLFRSPAAEPYPVTGRKGPVFCLVLIFKSHPTSALQTVSLPSSVETNTKADRTAPFSESPASGPAGKHIVKVTCLGLHLCSRQDPVATELLCSAKVFRFKRTIR